jgi:hypothetical protein
MKKCNRLFFVSSFLFTLILARVDHIFLKQNEGFSLRTVLGQASTTAESPSLTDEMRRILSQPFHYFAKGHQSFVFASEDNQHVVKLYRFPSHLRPLPWLNHPFSSRLSQRRKAIMTYNEEKLSLSLHSYQIAFEELQRETGVEWIHLSPTHDDLPLLHLIDRCGHHYEIPLDDLCIVVQKRFIPIFEALEQMKTSSDREGIRHVVSSLLDRIEGSCRKGIVDKDPVLDKNYGWDGKEVVYLDIGRFVKRSCNEIQSDPSSHFHCAECQTEAAHITPILAAWLQECDQELFNDFQARFGREYRARI